MRSLIAISTLLLSPFVMYASSANAAGLNGTWRGGGYIKPASGKRMRVSCVVSYSPQTSRVVSVRARCASNSGSIRQSGEVLKIRNSLYVGDFYNRQFDIRGRVRVSVKAGRQTVTFSSSDGGGRLSLRRR